MSGEKLSHLYQILYFVSHLSKLLTCIFVRIGIQRICFLAEPVSHTLLLHFLSLLSYLLQPCVAPAWELQVQFKIHGSSKELYGDGMALWYTKDRMISGPVFGSKDYFEGLAVIIDTYSNHNGNNYQMQLYLIYSIQLYEIFKLKFVYSLKYIIYAPSLLNFYYKFYMMITSHFMSVIIGDDIEHHIFKFSIKKK